MKRILASTLAPFVVVAVASAQEAAPPVSEGGVTVGVEQVDADNDSAKFNEYRDLDDGLLLDRLWLDLFDGDEGRYLEVAADRVGRQDQDFSLRSGSFGDWRLDLDWSETPHRLSNKAMTPLDYRGNGFYEASANVPIIFKKLNTASTDALGVLESDQLTAAYLDANLRPIALGSQRDRGSATLGFGLGADFDLRFSMTEDRRSGSKSTFGPIGDRPPRTLNIQLPEPLDYRTRDTRLDVGYDGGGYDLGFSYLISDFENAIDTLTWENIFATPAPGADYDVWDRAVGVYGRRPLAPDNRLHQATLTYGGGAPLGGRIAATVSLGKLEQDERLLPYSTTESILANPVLPQSTANAEMETRFANVTYTSNPVRNLNVRAFVRYYELDNQTPESDWLYVTSDTPSLTGTSSFKNSRTNLAYAYDTLNLGAEAQWRLGLWRSTLSAGLEREEIGRDYREADTAEDRLTLRWRARPADGVSLRARFLYGDRDGEGYLGTVTQQSYWYAPEAAGTDADNPKFTFSNHPDMRRFDVADRERNQLDLDVSWAARPALNVTATVMLREDDFDSDVRPTQPLAGQNLPDAAAFTPGDQLGVLDDEQRRFGLDASYAPSDRLTLTAFLSLEKGDSRQRSIEFNENNKANPSTVETAELGPWTRAGSQWTADSEDDNRTFGVGLEWVARPDRVTVRANADWTRGRTDIRYSGFGVTNWDGTPFPDTHQFAFRTPPTIENDLTTLAAEVELELWPRADLVVGYGYDDYEISDWQQEANSAWFESVGSEYLLRDGSRSHQWGNRLVNLGSYLAPSYTGHYGQLSLAFHF